MDIAQENMAVHSPKNKKQIGSVGKGDKIYIEDYAVTYLNQIARAPETGNGVAGLFGTCRELDGNKEYFIYAAVYQECENILESGLAREIVQKIMRRRAEDFCEYFFLGWALVLKENTGTLWESCYRSRLETLMGKPELLMTLQCKTCEEHFYLYPTEMPKETGGYFIFYEQNDGMQNFLIDWHGEIHKDKCDEEGDNVAESCRNYYKEKKAKRFRIRLAGGLLVASVLLLLFSAGVGVQNLNNYQKIQEVGNTVNEITSINQTDRSVDPVIVEMPEEYDDASEASINEVEQIAEETINEYEMPEEELTSGQVENEIPLQEAAEIEEQYITYEVSPGDTLYGICVKYYGNFARAEEICELNNIENMDNILYGEKIILPQ